MPDVGVVAFRIELSHHNWMADTGKRPRLNTGSQHTRTVRLQSSCLSETRSSCVQVEPAETLIPTLWVIYDEWPGKQESIISKYHFRSNRD